MAVAMNYTRSVSFSRDLPLPGIPGSGSGFPATPRTKSGNNNNSTDVYRDLAPLTQQPQSDASGGGGGIVFQEPAFDELNFSTKLSNVEAQRIMSVLQDAQRKLALIGMLPDTLDRKVTSVFGHEIVLQLQEHRQYENRYVQMNAAKESGDPITQKESWMSEYKEVSRQLRSTTRTIARIFTRNPTAMNKLRYIKSNKPPAVIALEKAFQEIKMLTYERLRTTVEEEKAKQDQLIVIIAKEQKTSAEVKTLQEELNRARGERTLEVTKKNEVIRKLKDDLRDIKNQAEESTKKLESRSKQKEDSDLQQFRDKETALKSEIILLRQTLAETCQKNREEELALRKKKYKIETEVENWIHKYDQDMEEKQTELEDLTLIFLEEKSQLDELQKRYTELQGEYNLIMKEREIAAQKKLSEEALEKKRNGAATKIQACIRSYLCRLQLKRIKDAKGKKGGAKGGKKGGAKKK